MKKQIFMMVFHTACIILLILFGISPQIVYSQNVVYVDYVESFNEMHDTNMVSLPIINKKNRLKSNSCISFKIEPDSNVPDSVVKCLEVATDIWRSCLNTNSSHIIKLQLLWGDLSAGEDIKTKVSYFKDADNNNDYVPASLYYSLHPDLQDDDFYDAIITINKNLDWDCGYSAENTNNVRSLNYALLRSIAVALGFGSSLSLTPLSTGSIIKFPFTQGHSLFDKLLVSDNGIWLKDLNNKGRIQNPEIVEFCTGVKGEVYIDGLYNNSTEKKNYKMYTPSNYENTKSLVYLDNEQSLMHYSLDKSFKKLQVDNITANVLNKIGWNLIANNQNNIKIIGNGIPDSGITSAYTPHQFYLDGVGTEQIINARWCFYIPTIEGNESLQKSTNGTLSFSIDEISFPGNYAVNVNGDIYGKIIFTGLLNGTEICLQYNLTLELKPSITNVTFVKRNNVNGNSYDVVCKVDYKGSDYLYVTLEEEYGSSLRSQFVREPYLAHFVCSNINSPYYAWIDIKVENTYGSDIYTIELPPDYYMRSPLIPNNIQSSSNSDFTEIKVYNSGGCYIKTIKRDSELNNFPPGLYVLKYYKEKSMVKTSKFLK